MSLQRVLFCTPPLRWLLPTAGLLGVAVTGCREPAKPLVSRAQSFAELRTIRRGVSVTLPGDHARVPYPRERLVDGEQIHIAQGGLAWVRRDGGAKLLVTGPADLEFNAAQIRVRNGRVFVDTPSTTTTDLQVSRAVIHLVDVRASLEVSSDGTTRAYVLKGAVRMDNNAVQASAGEELTIGVDGKITKRAVLAWEDWTGGLATTDAAAEPAPFGIGTVGARSPGSLGQARFALAIQKLDVRVRVDHDFAVTEVDEVFFNPSSQTVEGIYSFRTPAGATLHRFGVDREGELVWGQVKEKQAAAAQYQAHVYEGSTEDPALLEWDAPGVYKARLYPIKPGDHRRVVTRYAQWLGRNGDRGERRLYLYPMAAEGAEASLPRIEELTVSLDLEHAGATEVRAGMQGVQEGRHVTVRAYDLVPKADLAVELFDDGVSSAVTAYRAPHKLDLALLPFDQRQRAQRDAQQENADYLLVPVRPNPDRAPSEGLDLALVVDASAATQPASLALARASVNALLSHLGPSDRAAVWAGDATLRPVAPGSDKLTPVDAARREAIAAGLARVDRGGATDLGAVIAEAASKLDPGRRGAVVYIGDGRPTVGEMAVSELRDKLNRLAHPVRLFAIGVGDEANLGILNGITRGAFAERVTDAFGAANTALHLLEEAERPVWLGASVDLGPGVDRVYPRELGALVADETVLLVGRVTGQTPKKIAVHYPGSEWSQALVTTDLKDGGDLLRRWAEGRLSQLLDEGAGRASVVEVGTRFGVITPFTSFYVPTANEVLTARQSGASLLEDVPQDQDDLAREQQEQMRKAPVVTAEHEADLESHASQKKQADEASIATAAAPAQAFRDSREQPPAKAIAPGARSKKEGGPMGGRAAAAAPAPPSPPPIAAASPSPPATPAAAAPQRDAKGGVAADRNDAQRADGTSAPSALAAPEPLAAIADSFGAGGLGLSGAGEGGGSRGAGIGLGTIGGLGHGASTGQGTGAAAKSRLGGAHAKAASMRTGSLSLMGSEKAPSETPARLDDMARTVWVCSAGAALPLEDRVVLWRERLAAAGPSVANVEAVYQQALAHCEAPTWRERTRLLNLMLDALTQVRSRVELWRRMFKNTQAADVLYRGILARVRSTAELRELHDALGLRRVDPGLLQKTLSAIKTPIERVQKLHELVDAWPDDFELARMLLDGYEDIHDIGNGRALARRLRQRPDADARLRTGVGEYYLRLAKRPGGAEIDVAEARRTFGEIVEFAPDDPVARRRLGDLLRAHGWFDEAFRQYETLARLVPDDPTVPLLLASAAQGLGKVEEAVRWTEKAMEMGAPDVMSGNAKTARGLANVFLAWARQEAEQAGRTQEAEQLRQRARRLSSADTPSVTSSSVRVILTWSHPELHPVLWSNALGAPMPAPESNPLLGISQVVLSVGRTLEVRLEKDDATHAARLGAEATFTVFFNEGTDREQIVRLPVVFREPDRTILRFTITETAVREESL